MSNTHTITVVSRLGAIALIVAALPSRLAAVPWESRPPDIIVTTTPELEAALSPANAGAQILVRAGDYDLSHRGCRPGSRRPEERVCGPRRLSSAMC